MLNKDEVWSDFLEIMHNSFQEVTFNLWFGKTSLYEITDDKIILLVPMPLHKKMILTNYYGIISDAFAKITGINREIDCVLEDEVKGKSPEKAFENEIVNNFDDINNMLFFESNLNQTLKFDNFVVGDTNKFANTAALAVAKNPGLQYNPLFIYGKSGLGKTHLMHAIGNYIVDNNPKLKVLYTTSDDFRKDYFNLVSSNNKVDNSNNFKNKYRNIDVLIIDDIQFLVGAEKTQDEFFHIFNDLHGKNKQIIISSDRSPEDLKLLEERLRSRFAWGLPVDIYPPDFELRCRIVKEKIQNLSIKDKMTDEGIEFIANNFDTDVRSLEGAINRLVAYTAMCVPEKIDLKFANEALKDYITKDPYSKSDISNIQKVVADYYKLTVEVLKGKKRSASIAYPRMVAMYLCRMLTDESFPRIGMEFGGRDHSTVIHACDKIEEDIKINSELKDIINEIKAKL